MSDTMSNQLKRLAEEAERRCAPGIYEEIASALERKAAEMRRAARRLRRARRGRLAGENANIGGRLAGGENMGDAQ